MMSKHIFFLVLLFSWSLHGTDVKGLTNIKINTAKSVNDTNNEELTKVNNAEQPSHNVLQEEKESNSETLTQRHKRQGFYDYQVPYPQFYSPYSYRPSASDYELEEILRRIQEISALVRQPPPPVFQPPPRVIRVYLPVYRPYRVECNCPPNKPDTTEKPNLSTEPTSTERNNTTSIDDRADFNKTDMEDFTRPVSFDPIPPPRPLSKPPPPVEHGSVQAGLPVTNGGNDDFTRPVSFDPIPPNRPMRPPPPVEHGSSQAGLSTEDSIRRVTLRPSTSGVPSNQDQNSVDYESRPSVSGQNSGAVYFEQSPESNKIFSGNAQDASPTTMSPANATPTACDAAILSCCHRKQTTFTCLQTNGCRNSEVYRSPCDPVRISQVIDKYQRLYQNG